MRTWKLPAQVDLDQPAPGATMKHGIAVTARLHLRNAFNVGLLLLTCAQAAAIGYGDGDGEAIAFDARSGCITRADGSTLRCEPVPGFLLDLVDAGCLLPQLKRRLAQR